MLPLLSGNWSRLSSRSRPTSPAPALRPSSNARSGSLSTAARSARSGLDNSSTAQHEEQSLLSSASLADDASWWSLPLSDTNTSPTSFAPSECGYTPTLPSTANEPAADNDSLRPPPSALASTRRRVRNLRQKSDKECLLHCTYSHCKVYGKCSPLTTHDRHAESHENRYPCKICHEEHNLAKILKELDCKCPSAMQEPAVYHLEQHRLKKDFGGKQAGGKLMKLYVQRKSLEDHLLHKHGIPVKEAVEFSKEWKFTIRQYQACGMCDYQKDPKVYSDYVDLHDHQMTKHMYNNGLSNNFNLDFAIQKLLKSNRELDQHFQECITGLHAPGEFVMLTWQDTDSTGILDSLVLRMELEAFRLSPPELAALAARYVHVMSVDQITRKKIGARYNLDKTIASKSGLSCLVTDPFMGRQFEPSSYQSGSSNESIKYFDQQRLLCKASDSGISMYGDGLNGDRRVYDGSDAVDPNVLEKHGDK